MDVVVVDRAPTAVSGLQAGSALALEHFLQKFIAINNVTIAIMYGSELSSSKKWPK
jgi:hypothetical protein